MSVLIPIDGAPWAAWLPFPLTAGQAPLISADHHYLPPGMGVSVPGESHAVMQEDRLATNATATMDGANSRSM